MDEKTTPDPTTSTQEASRPIWRLSDLDDVEIGDRVTLLGSYELTWDEDCLKPADLEPYVPLFQWSQPWYGRQMQNEKGRGRIGGEKERRRAGKAGKEGRRKQGRRGWRFEGDPLCDAVVRALNLRAGMDGLEHVQRHMQLPADEQEACVRDFWEEVTRLPPPDISALPPLTSPLALFKPSSSSKSHPITSPSSYPSTHFTPTTTSTHESHPPPTLSQGQAVFWRYAAQIFASLLHFSLAGGFAAERIMGVLHETGYLVGGPAAAGRLAGGVRRKGGGGGGSMGGGGGSMGGGGCPMVSPVGAETGTGGMCPMSTPGATASTPLPHSGRMDKDLSRDELAAREKKERDRTYHRLLETTQAVIDYMSDMTPITGTGWQSAIRVRMLHSAVRVRLADKRGVRNVYDAAIDGIPINQEDTIMTLGSFAVSPIYAMRRMGFYMTKEEEEAYVAAWRHIGYYLGVSPAKLKRHFSSEHRAERLSACTTMHLFSYDATSPMKANGEPESIAPPDPTSTATYKLLLSTCHRPPFNRTMDESLCLARVLLGEGMADRLALPPPTRIRRARTHVTFRMQRLVHLFGRYYKYRVWEVVNPAFWLQTASVWARHDETEGAGEGKGSRQPGRKRFRPYSWETERVESTRTLIELVIFWQLGRKKAPFTVNEHSLVGEEPSDSVDNTVATEQHDDSVDSQNQGEKDALALDQAKAKRTVRQFRGLLIEMGAVMLAMGGLGCVAVYTLWRTATDYLS